MEIKGWWKAGQGEHEKQVLHAFDKPVVRPQLLYGSHIFNRRFIVFQTTIDCDYRKGLQTGGAAIPLTWIMLLQATTMTSGVVS